MTCKFKNFSESLKYFTVLSQIKTNYPKYL